MIPKTQQQESPHYDAKPKPAHVFPSAPFSPNDAVICSALVNAEYDMYDQWAARGCPSDPSQFSWAEPTGPLVPNGPTLSYLGPMWGVANTDDYAFPEPFAFLAWESNGRTYLGFRGSETSADSWEDAAFDQVSYDPIVPGFTAQYDSIGGNHDHQHCYFYAITHPNQPQGPIAALKSVELASSARTRVAAARRRYQQLKGNPQPRRQS